MRALAAVPVHAPSSARHHDRDRFFGDPRAPQGAAIATGLTILLFVGVYLIIAGLI